MPSNALIVSQAVPELRNAFPGWKLPTQLFLRAAIAVGGAVTLDTTRTTAGVTLTDLTGGNYTLTFPKCRRAGAFHGKFAPGSGTGTAGNYRCVEFLFAAGDGNANAGTIVVVTVSLANPPAVAAAAVAGQIMIDFWADLG